MTDKIEVISPVGGGSTEQQGISQRLKTLNGKKVAEMWNGDFKGEFLFPALRDALKERYPEVEVVTYSEFPFSSIRGTPAHQRELDTKMILLAKEKGCDALVSGSGG